MLKTKFIVDGKLYDIEKSTQLGFFSYGKEESDFRYIEILLMTNKNKEYWLIGEGGSMSKYAVYNNGKPSPGSKAFVLDEKSAKDWAEERLSADDYLTIFSAEEA